MCMICMCNLYDHGGDSNDTTCAVFRCSCRPSIPVSVQVVRLSLYKHNKQIALCLYLHDSANSAFVILRVLQNLYGSAFIINLYDSASIYVHLSFCVYGAASNFMPYTVCTEHLRMYGALTVHVSKSRASHFIPNCSVN